SRNLRIVEKRIGKITLAKANRNSSPTYSLVRFAPSHSLRMGDFFRKAVKAVQGLHGKSERMLLFSSSKRADAINERKIATLL
ncbi:hypothetical protein, partial [Heyndrickxia coagulans]|uniref:hypothetical protein n=1 Tax=Heyndrickxia coagulans TaxID=1398 RepID=UPI001F4615BC